MKKIAITLYCLLVCSVGAWAQVNAEQVLNIGRNVLSMEDYMLSIQYFNLAIKAKPYLADPYFYRGLAKLYLEDYDGAVRDCTEALERNKFKSEAYKLRGFALQNMGKDSLAINDYNEGLKYYPLDKYFLYYKAVALTGMKHYDDAAQTYADLLRAYPAFEEGLAGRARLMLEQGDTTSALNDIERSLNVSKNMIGAYLTRAEIEAARGQWAEASADMEQAIKLQPREAGLYVNRAYLRYNQDDYFGAMSDYNYALELDPNNAAATFNRALLRHEVKDLDRAATDFSRVLELEPDNPHARFNRGLVYMEDGKNAKALTDFTEVAKRFPRFHTVYYAMAQAYNSLGRYREAGAAMRKGDELVSKYVRNPERNPLDRPAISPGTTRRSDDVADDSDGERVMEQFNRLVTVNDRQESRLAYNDKIKGRVQDRDARVEPEPLYTLTYWPQSGALPRKAAGFTGLDEVNASIGSGRRIYLTNDNGIPDDERNIQEVFSLIDSHEKAVSAGSARPVDWLSRAVGRMSLRNYEEAVTDLDAAIKANPLFTAAYLARATARFMMHDTSENAADKQMLAAARTRASIADLDEALRLDPSLSYAWYDKGWMLAAMQDYTSALQCYTSAIGLDPDFGQAYFNRGLIYLQLGDRQRGMSDLSRAGELGVLPSYNVIKRMK